MPKFYDERFFSNEMYLEAKGIWKKINSKENENLKNPNKKLTGV